ncbi:MAG: glycosyltransferase [Chloroflexi bacterium]|nr:glycosyltransferase [Chloroflexota bacterium]
MKIAYIAASTVPSSTANSLQVMKVCQALAENGEKVHLLVPGKGAISWEDLARHYGVHEEFPLTTLSSWRPLKRFDFVLSSLLFARRMGADLVYTRMLWVAVGAQGMGIPVILEIHDLPSGRFGPWLFRRYLRSKSRKLTVLITHSLRRLLGERAGLVFSEQEVIIAPDGVDLERYDALPDPPVARQQLGLTEAKTAVYSGGFYDGRGLESLLELGMAFPEIQFLWIGGRSEGVEEWKARIRALGLKNVILTGFIANEKLPLYQAAADILLMPYGRSISGSSGGNIADVTSPMKMFEYMASGRVILTSDIPVLREVLNEKNACFYSPGDLADLKAKFSRLMQDPERRRELASQAKEEVQLYHWRARMQKIISVFGKTS